MPYAYIHYPFENVELFENNFPGHFVAEGLDQTRGWSVLLVSGLVLIYLYISNNQTAVLLTNINLLASLSLSAVVFGQIL